MIMLCRFIFSYLVLHFLVDVPFVSTLVSDDGATQSLEALVQKQTSTLEVLQSRQYILEQMLNQQAATIQELQASRDAQAAKIQTLQEKHDQDKKELQAKVELQEGVIQDLQALQLAQNTSLEDVQTMVDDQKNTLQHQASSLHIQETLQSIQNVKLKHQQDAIEDLQASRDSQAGSIRNLQMQLDAQGTAILGLQNKTSIDKEEFDLLLQWMNKHAAFHVDLAQPLIKEVDVGHRQPIKFSRVLLNIGNAYNVSTGIFTAPYDGIYLFTLTIYTMSSSDRIEAGIFAAGGLKAYAVSEGSNDPYDHDSCSTVVHLRQGDHVSAQQTAHATSLWGSPSTSFLGVLVHAD